MTILSMDFQSLCKELNELDLQSIRPLRAMMIGTGTDRDILMLKKIEYRAREIRDILKATGNGRESDLPN